MEKKYRKIGYIYCGLILGICFYVLLKTDVIQESFVQDIKQILVPSLVYNSDDNQMAKEIVPLLGMDEDLLENGENDLSYDDFSDYQQNILQDDTNQEQEAVVATPLEPEGQMQVAENEETTEEIVETIADFPVENGIMYSMDQLMDYDFLVTNCYAVDSSTSLLPEEVNAENLLSKDMKLSADTGGPKVLIYHTHGSESFCDSRPGVVEDTVIGVGDELTRILEEDYGIAVYHDRSVYDVVDGVQDRSYAYDLAGVAIDKILAENPSIEVVLDLHRDGVRNDVHLVREIDGRPTAQIMFLNGMSRLNDQGDLDYLFNPHKIDNLAFSLQMHLVGKENYGDLMRRIYVRGHCFNLNKMPKSSLIEVGAQTNTVEEAKNAMVPLGAILYKVLVGP